MLVAEPRRALVELAAATRSIAAAVASGDPYRPLDVLAEQTRRLFGGAGVAVQIVDPATGEFVRRRVPRLMRTDAAWLRRGARFLPDAFGMEALETGRPVFTADFRGDPRIRPEGKAALPTVEATMSVPVAAGGATVAAVAVHWTRPVEMPAHAAAVAENLSSQVAVAMHATRAMEGARQEGARQTAQLVGEQLADALAALIANAELLELMVAQEHKERVGKVVQAGWAAAEVLSSLRGLALPSTER